MKSLNLIRIIAIVMIINCIGDLVNGQERTGIKSVFITGMVYDVKPRNHWEIPISGSTKIPVMSPMIWAVFPFWAALVILSFFPMLDTIPTGW